MNFCQELLPGFSPEATRRADLAALVGTESLVLFQHDSEVTVITSNVMEPEVQAALADIVTRQYIARVQQIRHDSTRVR